MRIAVCALSAVLLSGCSWMGMGGNGHHGGKYATNSQYGGAHGGQYGQHKPCQIMAPTQPIPRGCAPHQVTIASQGAQGGFPQQPNFNGGYGAGNYATGGYGSHAQNAGHQAANAAPQRRLRKPKLRGQMSMGFEKSNAGSYLDYADFPLGIPGYNSADHNQRLEDGSINAGQVTTTTWEVDNALVTSTSPTISNDDVHSTPFRVAGGFEYIMSPRTTMFANAGITTAEGKVTDGITLIGTIDRITSTQDYDFGGNPNGAPTVSNHVARNEEIAQATYDFSDMQRVDFEVGGKHYFDPIMQSSLRRAVTPYVGASAGASHYNAQSVKIGLSQLFYHSAFLSENQYYDATTPGVQAQIYDAQWVPSGSVTGGLEWQMTPKTAMAFETGVRVEGGREYTNGNKTSSNVAIPFTIRGSYNF